MDLQTFLGGTQGNKSPASSHSPFPAPTSLRSLQESRDTAPGMEPSALQRSLVMLLVSSLP